MANHHLEWIFPIKMVFFHSYVELQGGSFHPIPSQTISLQICSFVRTSCRQITVDVGVNVVVEARDAAPGPPSAASSAVLSMGRFSKERKNGSK